jgi:hypothetical protein
MIAAGYEDGNDADTLRCDPMFKMALDLSPSDRELCSQPTISRVSANFPKIMAAHQRLFAFELLRWEYAASTGDRRRHVAFIGEDCHARIHFGLQRPVLIWDRCSDQQAPHVRVQCRCHPGQYRIARFRRLSRGEAAVLIMY